MSPELGFDKSRSIGAEAEVQSLLRHQPLVLEHIKGKYFCLLTY
jgi:hypothetical protein